MKILCKLSRTLETTEKKKFLQKVDEATLRKGFASYEELWKQWEKFVHKEDDVMLRKDVGSCQECSGQLDKNKSKERAPKSWRRFETSSLPIASETTRKKTTNGKRGNVFNRKGGAFQEDRDWTLASAALLINLISRYDGSIDRSKYRCDILTMNVFYQPNYEKTVT